MHDYFGDLINSSAAVKQILLESDTDEELDGGLADDETQTPLPMSGIDTVDASNSKKRKVRSTTSSVWNNFIKLEPEKDGKTRSQCKGCKKVYIAGDGTHGTSTMKRHIPKCRNLPKFHDLRKMMLNETRTLRVRQVDPLVLREIFPQSNASSGSYDFHMGDPSNRGDDPLSLDILEDLRNISFEADALHRKSSLDLYLDESVLDMNSKVDVLQY
ncbi:hypothetical protein PIB30_059243 [Stylosanthes scabra]|uniref:BED-type domain-containing protein n=1 Tax=Stylosanthes scabra TaxID=79078 RepID=A0ABU6UIY5_9FABA|nr:hypothetical protein [Stylosanthes scabra]